MMFSPGDRVWIASGPLEGRDGVVVTVEGQPPTVEVDVEVFQRIVRLRLSPDDLRSAA